MPSCAFIKCTNSSKTKNKLHGITFHTFPHDELWRLKWLQIVRKQRQEPDWLPTNNSRICSKHFKPEDMYTTNNGYKKVSKSAVPYFKAPFGTCGCSNYKTAVKVEPLDEPGASAVEYSQEDPLEARCPSPSGLSDIGSEDLEGALETPLVSQLKRQLRNLKKELEHKDQIIKEIIKRRDETLKEKDDMIESLKRHNGRLKEKNKFTKLLLAKMKKKITSLKVK